LPRHLEIIYRINWHFMELIELGWCTRMVP
jgi:hypothetical protein